MAAKNFIKRIYASFWGLATLYGVVFGVFMIVITNNSLTGLIGAVVGGAIFGLLMSFTQRKKFETSFNISEKYKVKKDKTITKYLKYREVPKSAIDRRRLIKYIDSFEKRQDALNKLFYPKKYSKILNYGLISLFFLITVSFPSPTVRMLAVIYPIVIGISLYGEYRNRVIQQRIDAIRLKLQN